MTLPPLPDDVWLLICKFVSDPMSIELLSYTCRALRGQTSRAFMAARAFAWRFLDGDDMQLDVHHQRPRMPRELTLALEQMIWKMAHEKAAHASEYVDQVLRSLTPNELRCVRRETRAPWVHLMLEGVEGGDVFAFGCAGQDTLRMVLRNHAGCPGEVLEDPWVSLNEMSPRDWWESRWLRWFIPPPWAQRCACSRGEVRALRERLTKEEPGWNHKPKALWIRTYSMDVLIAETSCPGRRRRLRKLRVMYVTRLAKTIRLTLCGRHNDLPPDTVSRGCPGVSRCCFAWHFATRVVGRLCRSGTIL